MDASDGPDAPAERKPAGARDPSGSLAAGGVVIEGLPAEAATRRAAREPGFAIDEDRVGRSVLRMAWPVVLEHFSFGLLAIVDLFLVGRYVGDDAVAGVGVAGLAMWLAQSGAFGIETGVTTVTGWDSGARRTEQLKASVQAGVAIATLWGIAIAIVAVVAAPLFITLMGLDGAARDEGVTYLRAIAPGMFGLAVAFAAAGAYRGSGNSRYPMLILLLVNVINAVATYLLVSGVIGIEMGVLGSGLALSAGALLGMTLMLASLARSRTALSWAPGLGRGFRRNASRILHIGIPAALEEGVFLGAFLLYTRIVATIGSDAVAAHTVALRILDIAIWPVFGLGTAATALVGQAMGAARSDLAAKVAATSQRLGIGVAVTMAAVVVVFAPQLGDLFTNDPQVRDQIATALRIIAFAYPGLALHFTTAGALRGAGDVLYVMFVLLGTAFLVRVPLAWFNVVVLGFGIGGAWAGALVEINLRATLTYTRFRRGAWRSRVV